MWGCRRAAVLAASGGAGKHALRWAVYGLLALLSVWAVAYEVADTVLGSWTTAAPFQGAAPDIPFAIAGLLLLVRGVIRRDERGWILIGIGALCWSAGDVYWSVNLSNLSSPPVPSWADAGYLSFCPLTIAGIVLLVRGRVRNAPRTLIADATAAALAVGAVSAAVVVRPVLDHATGGTVSVATNLAYPLVDLLLLGLIVGVVAVNRWRLERLWLLLGAAVITFWVADSLYLITVATNTYQVNEWFNPLWYVSPILAAWAAWLPHANRQSALGHLEGRRGIVMPLLFACTALGVLVWSSFLSVGVIAVFLCTLSLLVIMVRLVLTWRENAALLQISRIDALTDPLTGLGNRRALTLELERRLSEQQTQPFVLALFDLDGFKHYNDNFGHPAGDALLQRLGDSLRESVRAAGTAYRMGGDEFCALLDGAGELKPTVETAARALSERGEGFAISCSFGSVLLPAQAAEVATALRIADRRMYANKHTSRLSVSRQSGNVLLRALAERDPQLSSHLHNVAELAATTAAGLSLPAEEIIQIRLAAELHDVGKVAIPDAILEKPDELTEEEWAFIRRHTLIGERILAAAPSLARVAATVRSTHENFDGTGYPDGLAGAAIPLGARIIAVCDAFHAMTSNRPYRAAMEEGVALAELHRCAGSQFDPQVVEEFRHTLVQRGRVVQAA